MQTSLNVKKDGFNIHDEFIFKILLEFVKTRISIITSKKEVYNKKKDANSIYHIISSILKAKTHTKLLNMLKETLPDFFGFEDIGVLFYDNVMDNLLMMVTKDNKTEESEMDLIGMDSQSVIRFPVNLGIVGQVFKDKSVLSRSKKRKSSFLLFFSLSNEFSWKWLKRPDEHSQDQYHKPK